MLLQLFRPLTEGNTLSKTTLIKVPGVAPGWLRVDDRKKEDQRKSILTDQRDNEGTKGVPLRELL